jgi:hypothetical protein
MADITLYVLFLGVIVVIGIVIGALMGRVKK